MIEFASFITDPETCPYLHDRPSRQRVRAVDDIDGQEYARLLASGWRRFGRILFQPTCGSCRECVPIRVLAARFSPSRSQRRILRRNEDVRLDIGEPMVDRERLELYHRFHRDRSARRGWPYRAIGPSEYEETFVGNAVRTLEFRYFLDERLIAIAYVGEAADALNSIYAFSDPDLPRRSLGNFDVLCEILAARERKLPYVYLGFWVAQCPSMAYKAAFGPHQLLRDGAWRLGAAAARDD